MDPEQIPKETRSLALEGAARSCQSPAQLVLIEGASIGLTAGLGPPGDGETGLTIGRQADCGLVLPASAVSRRHARVTWEHERFWVEDLGSRNGVFLNGRALERGRRHDLRHRDVLQLSDCRLLFVTCLDAHELSSLATIHLDRVQIDREADHLLADFLRPDDTPGS